MNLVMLLFNLPLLYAVFIPAKRDANGKFVIASRDPEKQSVYRELIQANTWPISYEGRPNGVSQQRWVQNLLSLYEAECPGISFVWVPAILWETFLAWQEISRFPADNDPFEPFEIDTDRYVNWKDYNGTSMQLCSHLIGEFGGLVYPELASTDPRVILTHIEDQFLAFFSGYNTFSPYPDYYTKHVRALLQNIKAEADKKVPKSAREVHRMKNFDLATFVNTFDEEFDRLGRGEKTLSETVAELEVEALIRDKYLVFRVTGGYDLWDVDGERVRGIDWTRKIPSASKSLFETNHSHLDVFSPGISFKEAEKYEREYRSFGYSLLAGGWTESFMPKGACCLSYATYNKPDDPLQHGILYALLIDPRDIKYMSAALILPKIPVQEGYFGHGEKFHPRLGAAVDEEHYVQLGILTTDMGERENQLHDLVNMFIAKHARIIQIDHKLVESQEDGRVKDLISAQHRLANLVALDAEHIDLQKQAQTTFFAFDMWNRDDIHPVLRYRINGILNRYVKLCTVFDELLAEIEAGETVESIAKRIEYSPMYAVRKPVDRESWIKHLLCYWPDERFMEKAEMQATRTGIDPRTHDPLLIYLIKSDWSEEYFDTYDETLPENHDYRSDDVVRTTGELKSMRRHLNEIGLDLNDYTFTINQLG